VLKSARGELVGGGPRILCVDDEEIPLLTRRMLLEAAGYTVFTATTVQEALDVVARKTVALVILDFLLGEMDGLQVARELKRLDAGIPVVVLSGQAAPQKNDGQGYDGWVQKGGDPQDLLRLIAELLQNRARGSPQKAI